MRTYRSVYRLLTLVILVALLVGPMPTGSATGSILPPTKNQVLDSGMYRTHITWKNSVMRARLDDIGVVVLEETDGNATILVDDVQLADLARLRFEPRSSDELGALLAAQVPERAWLQSSLQTLVAQGVALQSRLASETDSVEALDSARNDLHATMAALTAEQRAGVASSSSVDDDGDGLTNTQEGWWCTDLMNPDTDSDGRSDGVEIQALKDWLANRRAGSPGETPWPNWPFNATTCPDKDHDSIPNLAERWELGLDMDLESSDRDRYDDGQESFGTTYCPGSGSACGYGQLPSANHDGILLFPHMPSWVTAPGDHPLVAALPRLEFSIVPDANGQEFTLQTATVVTVDERHETGETKSYSTTKTDGTSTSDAETQTWENWQEYSKTTEASGQGSAPEDMIINSTEQRLQMTNVQMNSVTNNSTHVKVKNTFNMGGGSSVVSEFSGPATSFVVDEACAELGCRKYLGSGIRAGVRTFGQVVQGTLLGTSDVIQDEFRANNCDPTSFNPGQIWCRIKSGGTLFMKNYDQNLAAATAAEQEANGVLGGNYLETGPSTLDISRIFPITFPEPRFIPTETNTTGSSSGGARTTTQTTYQEHAVTEGSTHQFGQSWGTATAENSIHAADLWFAYRISNIGDDYARVICSLAINVYIGDLQAPAATYFPGNDLGGNGCFNNFQPGESHTYSFPSGSRIALTLQQMGAIDQGEPVRFVVEDYSLGQDDYYADDAMGDNVQVAIEDGTDDSDEAIDTYLIPTWGEEMVLAILARYFPHTTDADGMMTAIWTPEYRSDTPAWCVEPQVVGSGSQRTLWCKHALSTADWWNIYTNGMGDGSEGLQDTPASPGSVALFRFNKDSDLDGYSDRSEIRLGTDPNDPADYPRPELIAGVHNIRTGDHVVATLSLLNTGLYDAYGVEAVMIAPNDTITVTNNTVGGSGRVRAQKQVVVGSRILTETPLPQAWQAAGHAKPAAGGYYTGTADRTYTFTVQCANPGGCQVGSGSWTLGWNDGAGANGSLSFGAGYDSPTLLDVGTLGVRLGLLSGTVANGESFTVEARTPPDTFQYDILSEPHTPPVVIVSYNDPQGNHRFAIPPAAMDLTTPSDDLLPFSGQMLPDPGVEIVTTGPFNLGANTTSLQVVNPTETTLSDAHLFLEFIDISGTVASEVTALVTLPPGPTVAPVAWDTVAFDPPYAPDQDYIVMAFLTDYQGNILDSAGRPLSSFQEDPAPAFAMATEDETWDFGTAQQGTLLKRRFTFANTGFGDLLTYVSAPPELNVTQTGSRRLPSGDATTYEITLKTADLAVGAYAGDITIRTSDPAEPSKTVHVAGAVTPAPADTPIGALQRPLDWPATVSGTQGQWVEFAHTLGPEPASLHPVKVYSQDYATMWGVGKYATAFSAGTASYEMFGDGRDGPQTIAASTTDSPIDSACSGSAGSYALSATNASFAANQAVMIHQTQGGSAGTWMLNKIAGYSAGTITLQKPLNATYSTGAQVLVVKQYTDVTVNSGATWTSKAWNGTTGGILAFLANGTVTVSGAIVADAVGFLRGVGRGDTKGGQGGEGIYGRSGNGAGLNEAPTAPGGGGGAGGDTTNPGAASGPGSGGAGGGYAKGTDANQDEGAGAGGGGGHVYGGGGGGGGQDSHLLGGYGGASNAALGGGGGAGAAGAGGASGNPGGGSGGPAGVSGYTGGGGTGSSSSEHGSAGGGGGGNYGVSDLSKIYFGSGGGAGGGVDKRNNGGKDGGNGAGIVLIAGQTITLVSGAAIRANGATGITSTDHGGSGGGGAGGSVLLRAGQASLGASGVSAQGGNGGSPSNPGGGGGQGSPGRIRVEYCNTLSGSTNPAPSTQKLDCYLTEQVESSPYTTTRVNLPESGSHNYQVQYGRKLNWTGAANQVTTLRVSAGVLISITLQALVSDMPSNGNLTVDVGNDGVDLWSLSVANAGQYTSANLAAQFNDYWATRTTRPTTGTIDVPVKVTLDRAGQVLLTNLQVTPSGSKTRYLRLPAQPQGYSSVTAGFTVSGGSGPLSVAADVGNDGIIDWAPPLSTPTYPASLTTDNLATAVNAYLAAHPGTADVPLRFYLAPFATLALQNFTAMPSGSVDLALTAGDIAFSVATPMETDPVAVTTTVHNNGSLASGPLTASFFATAPGWGEWYIGSAFVPSVPPGSSSPATIEWNTLGFTGNVPVRVVVDPYDRVAESNETNNQATRSITILTRPDLQVTAIGLSDDEPLAGETVDLTLTLANGGQTAAAASTLSLYDGMPDSGGTLVCQSTPAVPASATVNAACQWTPDAPGLHRLYAVADQAGVVNESDEGNNAHWVDVYVGFAGPLLLDSGGPAEPPYTAEGGHGYLNGQPSNLCGAGPEQTLRIDPGGEVQYRFDHLLPGHAYHLDLTLVECDSIGRQEQILVDGNLIQPMIDLGDQAVHRLSLLLDPALYADRTIVLGVEEILGNDAVVAAVELHDIYYRYSDAGGANDPQYIANLGHGWLDGVVQTTWGTLPYQSRRIDLSDADPADDPDNELRYRFDGLDADLHYQARLTFYQGAAGVADQTVYVDEFNTGPQVILSGIQRQDITVEVPKGAYALDGSVVIRVVRNNSAANAFVNEISVEQKTLLTLPAIRDVRISNANDQAATISWLTDQPASGEVHFGTTAALGRIARDERGPATISRTHHVRLTGLTPATTYYLYVASADAVDDNGGALYQLTTGPVLSPQPSVVAYGQVFLPDGSTPATGAVVYATLRNVDGQGSPGDSALLSYLVQASDGGYWNLDLGAARIQNLQQPFSFSPSDQLVLMATDGSDCSAELSVIIAGSMPAPPLVLSCATQEAISLHAGWSLVGLRLVADPMPAAEQALDEIEAQGGNSSEIDRWVNGGWNAHIHNLPFNDFPLELGRGYFVKSTQAGVWQRSGRSLPNPLTIQLTPGWNLMSLPRLTCSLSASQALSGIAAQGGACSEIDRWLNGGWVAHIHNLPFNNYPLVEGEGYFVKCSQPSSYTPCQAIAEITTEATPGAAPLETDPASQPAADPVISDVLVTNRRDVALTVTWRTDLASDGWVEYGPTPTLGQVAHDDRGQGTVATLHSATLGNLSPETTYYYRIHSGNTVVGQGNQPFQVTTRPVVAPGTPVTIYGQVQYADGTPATGSLLIARLVEGGGEPSEPLSALVDGYGYWVLSLPEVDCTSTNITLHALSPAGEVAELTHPACQCQPAPVIQFGGTVTIRSVYLPVALNQ